MAIWHDGRGPKGTLPPDLRAYQSYGRFDLDMDERLSLDSEVRAVD